MAKATVHDTFQSAIEAVVLAAARRVPLDRLADDVMRQEPQLIAEMTPTWQRQAVLRELRAKRTEIAKQERQRQMAFPGFETYFRRIPKKLPVGEGRAIKRDETTYTEARKYLAHVLRGQRNAEVVKEAREMVALLHKHSRAEKAITWARVKEIEGPKAKYAKAGKE